MELPNPAPKTCEQEKLKAMVDSVIEFITASRNMLCALNQRLKDSARAKEDPENIPKCNLTGRESLHSLIKHQPFPTDRFQVHLRDVSVEEGAILARSLECGFTEVAASEQIAPVAVVFQELCRAVLASRRKSKHSLLERMLGSRTSNLRLYVRGKSDSALPKD
ncbi:uncharacterized protein LOC109541907 [Dendroctonus ponderosae]|uniref:uncharacterized protein LOC109541907 n=1 Tax=Dendroctonus ponderosae TaxID=77166 RepID=UPI002034CB6A|nr:uncharacterized protein LOC109541907 [Dendroctonus ponderosae]